jgi:hypothetical protein
VDQTRIPDSNFCFDPDPDPDPGHHQNDADPHADLTLRITHVGKSEKNFTYIHSGADPHWFLLFVSVIVMGRIIYNIWN